VSWRNYVTQDTDTEGDEAQNHKTHTLKSSRDVGEVFSDVAKDLPDDKKHGAVRNATDVALILYLDAMADIRPDVVEYHSQQEGWDFADLREDVLEGVRRDGHGELVPVEEGEE
jgi:hypothetical protein